MQTEKYRLMARGRLAACRQTIEGFQTMAAKAPHWGASIPLQAECRAALETIEQLEQRLDRKLIVTIVGPTGSGKSTLLNALAGSDELSPTGIDRPTTRQIVVYCRQRADADELLGEMLPRNVYVQIYSALLETSTSEHAARMLAMDNATNACNDMIDNLTLIYNKARQAAITAELMDIVGGAEALKG